MSNNLAEFNFQDDLQEKENRYPISDMSWVYINDINQGNYSNGYINWSNVSIIGSNVEKQFFLVRAISLYRIQLLSFPQVCNLFLMIPMLMLFQ